MKAAFLGALCVDLCLFVPAASAQSAEHPRYRVEIEAPADLKEMLRGGLSLVRWQDDPEMTPALLDRLVDEAKTSTREAAAAEGWFSAAVTAEVDRSKEPWTVKLRVEPGPRTTVEDVQITFAGPVLADAQARQRLDEVRKQWSLRKGEPFRQSAWDAAKQQAVLGLSAWRYAAARLVDSRATVDRAAHRVTLSVTLDSGPPFRFGAIEVAGTRRYPEAFVRYLNPIQTGATYDRSDLVKYERRLLESNYFISAHAAVDPQSPPDNAPVHVNVIEGPSQNLDVGLYLNTDTGFRPELHYANSDVLDRAWRFRTDLNTGLKIQSAAVNLDLPPHANGNWINLFTTAQRSDVQNLRTTDFAVGVGLNHGAVSAPSGPAISYHIEDHKVSGATTDTRTALYFAYRFAFRDTDDFISPRRGYLGTSSVGFAPSGVSTRQFARMQVRASWLHPLGRDDLLVRGELGAVLAPTRAGIPSTFLFRTGGDQSVRGYAFESLGVAEGNAIVGGRYLAVASVEATHWVGANWGVAAFVDAGDAWDQANRFDPALGYGFGVRFRTPVGPIRADIAYGERVHKVRLHFSIGYTF